MIFGNLCWMFGGYAWLTNVVPPRAVAHRLLILVGMAAFTVIALSIPDAFGASGIALGLGYLVVTLVNSGLFLSSTEDSIVHAMAPLGPFNLVAAGLFLAGGVPHGSPRWVLWTAAFVLHWRGRTGRDVVDVRFDLVASGPGLCQPRPVAPEAAPR